MNPVKRYIYCKLASAVWTVGYRLYHWAEDRRPAGGFKVKNYRGKV